MEIVKQMEDLGKAFNEFKAANDLRLKQIEAKGSADPLTEEKVNKLNSAMTEIEAKISAMTAAANRTPNFQGEEKAEQEMKQYQKAIDLYMRKGVEPSAEILKFATKDMSVDSDVDGGFLVNPAMAAEMQKKIFESSPIRQLADVVTITTDSYDIIHDLDEVGASWVGEVASRAKTTSPTLKKSNIPVHEIYAFPMATQKFLDDAGVNVEAWLQAKCVEKFARSEASAFISGDGMNKPKGITAYGSGDGFGLIQRKETAVNSAFTADEVIDTQALLKEAYQANATWLINRLQIAVIRKFKDVTSGQYLWQPGLAQGAPATLLGRPVMMASDLPSAVTAATDHILYGDFKAGYQIVDRIGVRVLRDPYSNKPYVGFYTTKRVGGAVKDFEAIKSLKIKA